MKLYKATANGMIEFSEEDYAIYQSDQAKALAEVPVKMREKRNELLAQTDWTQGADVPQTVKDRYAAYRQALRDVPQQPGFPENITWPTKPE